MAEERDIAAVELTGDEGQTREAGAAPRSQTSARSRAADARVSPRAGRAVDIAIARINALELEPVYSLPPIDLLNPKIPKAPALPHDLSRMPNAQLPIWSDPPSWVMTDPLSEEPTDAAPAPATDSWSSGPVYNGDARTKPEELAGDAGARESSASERRGLLRGGDLVATALLLAALTVLALQWVGC